MQFISICSRFDQVSLFIIEVKDKFDCITCRELLKALLHEEQSIFIVSAVSCHTACNLVFRILSNRVPLYMKSNILRSVEFRPDSSTINRTFLGY